MEKWGGEYVQGLHVYKIEKHIQNGCTEPFLTILNTGEEKIIQLLEQETIYRVNLILINELVSYKLTNSRLAY